jgi:hypothetical protein
LARKPDDSILRLVVWPYGDGQPSTSDGRQRGVARVRAVV